MALPTGITPEVALADYTSWLVGGKAEYFAQPSSVDELRSMLEWAARFQHPVAVLSGGTNVLVSDRGVRGLVIVLGKLSGLTATEQDGRVNITCFAGAPKSTLLKTFLKYKLEPALFLAGLPGDVGGGVAMNAGVGEALVPREFVEITDWIEVLKPSSDGKYSITRFDRAQLSWSYRHCTGWQPGVITRVGLSWPLDPHADILERVRRANQTRLMKQPLDMPSCGSVFVNPPGFKSGQLIEQAGLKGFTIGGAQVSEKHANFIVNRVDATAQDIHLVIEHVRAKVLAHSGVDLHTEVVYLGRWP